jgi:hypothetical protein
MDSDWKKTRLCIESLNLFVMDEEQEIL